MGGKLRSHGPVIVFTLLAVTAYAQEDGNTTLAPPAKDIAMQSGICRICNCTADIVDCYDRNITNFFTLQEWTDLTNVKPTHVDLSENFIRNVTAIGDLPIEVLNLSRCSIEFIAKASFKDMQEMRVLDLSHNALTPEKLSPHAFEGRFSPEEYEPLASMRVLNLGYNELHSLNPDLFEHLPELSELDLSGNPLKTLDHVTVIALSSLPYLKILRLRSCQLTDIPDKMLHTPRYLERLDLSDNKLTAVPQELEETKNLIYLNLNQNPIVELNMDSEEYPGFPRLRKLQELHMCNMPNLRKIGVQALAGMENLVSLHMSFNPRLRYIDAKALARPDDIGETFDWPPIKELYLQYNNLTELDRRLIARWDQVKMVNVSNNPFLCDCSTQWMVDDLVPIIDKISTNASADLICEQPVEMRGYSMKHLHDIHRTMRCVDKYGNRPEKDGAMLLGTLIGVLLAVPIMLGLMLLWRHGYFAWIGLRGPVSVSRAFYKRAPADDNYI